MLNKIIYYFFKSAKSTNQCNSGSRQKAKRVYFDYASSTGMEGFVLDKYVEVSKKYFGNASSIHSEGESVKEVYAEARKRVAKCIKARVHNVYFTGSTTEANNIFIKGVLLGGGDAPAQIIYSLSDHSAIIEPILWCKKFVPNVTVTNVKPNKIGKILVDDVLKSLNENTKLICLSYVNSETGTIQDIKRTGQEVRKYWEKNFGNVNFPKIFIDATQAIKYFEIDVHNLGVDGISFGFSKVGGIAGSAVLWVRDQTKLESIISGGGQEEGIRSGTENIPAIVANSYLLEKVCDRKTQTEKREYVYGLRNYLLNRVNEINSGARIPPLSKGGGHEVPGDFIQVFGDTHFKYNKFYEDAAPHIVLLSVKDMLGEELCLRLDARGVAVSTASACSLLENSGSNFLKSIKEPMLAKETIRISLSEKNTKDEIDKFVEALKVILEKYVR
jgi:cysteine desulfurase